MGADAFCGLHGLWRSRSRLLRPLTGQHGAATHIVARKRDSPKWVKGCKYRGKVLQADAKWSCDIKPYDASNSDRFRAFLGQTTDGDTSFNCFMDGGHATHRDANYNMCYAEMYCNHEYALSIELGASETTAKAMHRSTVKDGETPKGLPSKDAKGQVLDYLDIVKDLITEQQCKLDPYLTKLADTVLTIFDTDSKDLFIPHESKDRTPQQPICDLAGNCKYPPELCDYYKDVEMPSRYQVSAIDKALPNS
ncbi:hypothetical protein LTR49_028057, partial [Elasticomyces elasticus]